MIRNRLSNWFINMPKTVFGHLHDLLALAIRIWVGMQFFKSGWLKVSSWENTLFLFREEYHVPLLDPTVAAIVGTAGELCFPMLLFVGLFGRLSALGLFFVNVVAVLSYAHVLLSDGFEAALAQHVLWGFALVILAVYGPGRASLDALIVRGLPDRRPLFLT